MHSIINAIMGLYEVWVLLERNLKLQQRDSDHRGVDQERLALNASGCYLQSSQQMFPASNLSNVWLGVVS